jgi:hypothetical protein
MKSQAEPTKVSVRRLESGFYHVRGVGPCNWAQPPAWPCSEDMLRQSAHPEAGEGFIRAALHEMTKEPR